MARFIISNTDEFDYENIPELESKDSKSIEEAEGVIEDITLDMEEKRFHLAGEKIYNYMWKVLADKLIEERKEKIFKGNLNEKKSAVWTLYYIFTNFLKILHPFMPFVTEEVWSMLPHKKTRPLLMVETWPKFKK
jgi:valyl-tRNA synthetase